MDINLKSLPHPTDLILEDFASQILHVQSNLIKGMYVTGSIPLGDYYSKKSDIDFLAFLNEKPKKEILRKFAQIHFNIERKYNSPKLNGYYLTLEELRKNQLKFPSFFKEKMLHERHFELDKIALYELQTISLNILGQPASDLSIETPFHTVAYQLYQNINSYWTNWIHKHAGLSFEYFLLALFPRLTEWGILGVARQLYTLELKKITSKLNAGLYYHDKLPKQYHGIISTAIETRKLNKTQILLSFKRANQTIDCMKFIIGKFNAIYTERYLEVASTSNS